MTDKYVLVDKKPMPCDDVLEWAKKFDMKNRHVADDKVNGVRVSTVFLGVDHSFGEGPPMLFETMIFGGDHDQYQERYSTWDDAERGHKKALALVQDSKRSE